MSLFDIRKLPGFRSGQTPLDNQAKGLYNRSAKAVGWGTGNDVAKAIPRFKFNFFANLVMNPGVSCGDLDAIIQNGSLTTPLRSIDIPSVSYDVEKIRQYNRDRFIVKKVENSELTVTFYDDATSYVRGLIAAYRAHYTYGGSLKPFTTGGPTGQLVTGDAALGFDRTPFGSSFGLADPFSIIIDKDDNVPSVGMKPVEFAFFDHIIVADFGSEPSSANVYYAYNPVIKSITAGNMAYDDNEAIQEVSITFMYEQLVEQVGIPFEQAVKTLSLSPVYTDSIDFTKAEREDAFAANGLSPQRTGTFQKDESLSDIPAMASIRQSLQSPASLESLARSGVSPSAVLLAVQKSIQGGEINYEDLRENIFRALARGTAIQDIRIAARKAKLVRQAIEQGRFLDIAPLLGDGVSAIENFTWETTGRTASSVVETMKDVSGTGTWLEQHANVGGLKKLGGAFGVS